MTQPTPPKGEIGHTGQVVPPWSTFGQSGGGIGLDPDDVPQLRWPNNIAIYERMRTDAQIDALIRSVSMPIRGLRWVINPNGARDEITESIASDLNLPIKGTSPDDVVKRGRKRFNHDEHLRMALLAPTVYGHMFFEQAGEVDDNLIWHIRKLSPRMPRSIAKINVAKDGGLESIVQYDSRTSVPEPIPVSALAAYVWEREGANWTGRSLLRPLYKHYLLKDRLLRVDAIKNERFGAGIPTGTAPPGGDPADYQKLAAATRASENGGVGLPNGGAIGIEGVRGTLPDTLGSIRYHDEQMARTFLAMFIQLGTTETGSRALGESMVDFFEDSLVAFAKWYQAVTNEHVIEDIVDWNWGTDENAPLLEWEEDEKSPLSAAELANLVTSGALIMDEELQGWMRERFAMPAADPATATAPPGASPVVAAAVARVREQARVRAHGGDTHDQKSHGNRTADEPDATETTPQPAPGARVGFLGSGHTPEPSVAIGGGGGGHVRILTSSQTVGSPKVGHRDPSDVELAAGVDFDRLQREWQTETDRLVTAWGPVRDQQIAQLVQLIADAVDAGDAAALAAIQADVLGQELLLSHFTTLAEASIAAAVAEAAAQGVTLEAPDVGVLADSLAARAEATATLLARSISESAARQALNRYGVDNATGADVASGVADHLGNLSDAYLNDQLGGALTGAQNAGRFATMAAGTITSAYASELLDQNTCEQCGDVDGTVYADLDAAAVDYPSGGYVDCAGGPRCRGTVVAVYAEEQG